jgi:cell filamentation protein, protein adenylyltransferase
MTPLSWVEVDASMSDWEASLSRINAFGSPIGSPAVAHSEFERINPFLDGNGCTGRLLLNLILIRMGYPPVTIDKRVRARYPRSLRRADEGDLGPLVELIARAIIDILYRFVVSAGAGPNRLVPLAALATKERSVMSLRAAIVRGRLRAQKVHDSQWRSTRAWLDDYVASKHRRR